MPYLLHLHPFYTSSAAVFTILMLLIDNTASRGPLQGSISTDFVGTEIGSTNGSAEQEDLDVRPDDARYNVCGKVDLSSTSKNVSNSDRSPIPYCRISKDSKVMIGQISVDFGSSGRSGFSLKVCLFVFAYYHGDCNSISAAANTLSVTRDFNATRQKNGYMEQCVFLE
ncbi:hypothetical protein B0H11DRAFT_1937031 [Mycena galericulata]|nr:hypothetical protein B0H11DRAFT_1937031 [Mycena galericulata]